MKLWRLAVAVLFLLLMADLVRGLSRGAVYSPEMLAPGPAAGEPPPRAESQAEIWGPSDAKVLIGAYLPRGNPMADRTLQAVRTVTLEFPKVRAEVLDMRIPATSHAMQMRGIKMPGLVVNGKTDFRVRLNGRVRQVSLLDVKQLKTLPLTEVLRQIVREELQLAGSRAAKS